MNPFVQNYTPLNPQPTPYPMNLGSMFSQYPMFQQAHKIPRVKGREGANAYQMKIIKELSKMIEEELEDADKYIKCAIQKQEEDPALADLFYTLSKEEMGHMNRLHEAVTKKIREHRAEHGDPPLGMQALYDYLHEAHMEKASRIQWYITKYSEK